MAWAVDSSHVLEGSQQPDHQPAMPLSWITCLQVPSRFETTQLCAQCGAAGTSAAVDTAAGPAEGES